MLFRRILMTALMTAARNPAVQKKAGEAAGKALKRGPTRFVGGKPQSW